MIEFLIFAALLALVALVFVLLPLWRARAPAPDRRRDANITIYHQRREEIDREVAAGRLSATEAERETDRLGARLLADVDGGGVVAGASTTAGAPWLASVVAIVLVVGIAGASYGYLGQPQAVVTAQGPSLAAMIEELEARVASEPDDLQARAMLANARENAGDFAGAARNYRAINTALADRPQAPLLVLEANATLRATDDLQGRAADLYREALSLDEANAEALWYLALGAAERAEPGAAIAYLDRLLALDLPPEFAEQVRDRRAELAGDKPTL